MTRPAPAPVLLLGSALLLAAALSGCGGEAAGDPPADAALDAGPPASAAGAADVAVGDVAPAAAPDAAVPHPALTDPSLATARAPEAFAVYVETTAGVFYIDVIRAWSPNGADRFYNLARVGFLDGCAFFRVIDGFVAQSGLHGDPLVAAHWQAAPIPADPVVESNVRGTVAFATIGGDPESRRTQFFVNAGDNSRLDDLGFSPFGRVRDMTVIDGFYAGYGDGPPSGTGPDQARIRREGNAYLHAEFPELDFIVEARVVD